MSTVSPDSLDAQIGNSNNDHIKQDVHQSRWAESDGSTRQLNIMIVRRARWRNSIVSCIHSVSTRSSLRNTSFHWLQSEQSLHTIRIVPAVWMWLNSNVVFQMCKLNKFTCVKSGVKVRKESQVPLPVDLRQKYHKVCFRCRCHLDLLVKLSIMSLLITQVIQQGCALLCTQIGFDSSQKKKKKTVLSFTFCRLNSTGMLFIFIKGNL